MDIVITKWIVLVTLLVSTFIFSMLPLKLVSTLRNTTDHLKRVRLVIMLSSLLSRVYHFSYRFYLDFVGLEHIILTKTHGASSFKVVLL